MKCTINDIAVVISESIPNPAESGYDIFVGLEHYDSGEVKVTRYGSTENLVTAVKVFKKGDILLARRNVYLKRAGLVDFDGVTSGDSIVLRVKDDLSNIGISSAAVQKYLPFVLNTEEFWNYAEKYSDGTMSKRLSPKTLLQYEFDIPEDVESKNALLWAAFEAKESYRAMIRATDEMVKSQFIERYGNSPKQCIGDIAKEWSKGQPFKKDNIIASGSTPCIHYGELFTKYGPYIDDVCSTTNDAAMKVSQVGDILFPASDVTPNGLTRCSAIMRSGVLLGGDIIILRLREGLSPEYTSYAICMQKQQLLECITGSVIKHLSAKSILNVKVPIPANRKDQDAFVAIMRQADKSKFELKQAIEKIDKVMRALMK